MPIQELLQQLLRSIVQLILALFNPLFLIPAIILIIILAKKNKEYKSGAYYQITKLPYGAVKHDTGRYGEYLTYKYLKHFESNGARFLFNVYIPKEDGETTEIDVLMIHTKGLFVFESKNYSGWIFGNETQKNWYQTLSNGRGRSRKEPFYNPIMQNRSHIKHLQAFLGEQVPMWSIIVFSERCTLKNIQLQSNDFSVIYRDQVAPVVAAICSQIPADLLSQDDIASLYDKLYPYTQVDAASKAQHIANIHNNLIAQPAESTAPPVCPATNQMPTPSAESPQAEHAASTHAETVATKTDAAYASALENQPGALGRKQPQVPRCPKCNGNLILRTAVRGANAGKQFYGCANYPKCKYIQNLE